MNPNRPPTQLRTKERFIKVFSDRHLTPKLLTEDFARTTIILLLDEWESRKPYLRTGRFFWYAVHQFLNSYEAKIH